MPYKHQTESYRTRNGKRYEAAGDLCDASAGDLREQARELVRTFQIGGRDAFYERQDGGAFYRVFAETRSDH